MGHSVDPAHGNVPDGPALGDGERAESRNDEQLESGAFQDISDQVNARPAIARSEERYRTLFDLLDEGFCEVEVLFDEENRPVDYRFLEMNPAFERHTGLKNAVGKAAHELVPDLESRWREIYGRVALTGKPTEFVEHSETMERWFYVKAIRSGAPEQRRVALLFRDITESKKAEEAASRELRDYRRVQEVSCRLIPTKDVQSLYRELLDAAVEIMGADSGTIHSLEPDFGALYLLEVRGLPEGVWDHRERTPREALTSYAEAARTSRRVITDYLTDEGIQETAEARSHLDAGIRTAQSTPLISRSGQVMGILTTHWHDAPEIPDRSLYLLDTLARQAADLIERAHAEERLREADRRKDEFLAVLGHELRNPLAALGTALTALEGATDDPDRIHVMSTVIRRQFRHLDHLVHDLLDVSRISLGKIHLGHEGVDMTRVVQEVTADVASMWGEKGLAASVNFPDCPVYVRGDRARLEQVVKNLLHNAWKFTPSGGEIRVTAEEVEGEARITVSDTGIGIRREELSRIFGQFDQATDSPDHPGGGLGIGLALAKSLVELHGGTIDAWSDGPGAGSEFTVHLPTARATDAEGSRADGGATGTDLEKGSPARPRKIVLAEDTRDLLEVLALVLREKGHTVETAEDGASALELILNFRPDVALLDIGMPGLDGYEVARRVRQEPWGGELLLVAMTGWGQERDRARAREAGFDRHLVKPVNMRVLQEVLEA